jgi:hypothetical protein
MPVMLMTADDVEHWLTGTVEEALELQKPASDTAVVSARRPHIQPSN